MKKLAILLLALCFTANAHAAAKKYGEGEWLGNVTFDKNIAVTGNITANDTTLTGEFYGNATGAFALNATNLSQGTVPTARLGTGTANNTSYLRGDQTWQVINMTNNQVFYANGTFTAPSGISTIYLSGCAGGGGSAGSNFGVTAATGGGGSGAGVSKFPYNVTAGNNYTVTVGTGGSAGSSGGGAGGSGTNTTFNSTFILRFGAGSTVAAGGLGGSIASAATAGGIGVSASGIAASGSNGGAGGSSLFGNGGEGSASTGSAPTYGYCGGGGGAGSGDSASHGGAAGKDGILIIEW